MPIDQNEIYCSGLAITGDTNSNNVIDHSANTYHGVGPRPLYIPLLVTEAFTDTGDNSTADIVFQSSQYEAFNSSITNTVIGKIATNQATGYIGFPIMPPLGQDQRYSRLTTVVSGGNFSTGKISAWVVADLDVWKAKALGYTGPTTS